MHIQGFADDIGDGHAGVERGIRVLEDHGGLLAEVVNIGFGLDFFAVVPDFSRSGLIEMQNRAADCRFAAAGFADETQGLALVDGERDAVDSLEGLGLEHPHADIKILLEVLDLDQRLVGAVMHRDHRLSPLLRFGPG